MNNISTALTCKCIMVVIVTAFSNTSFSQVDVSDFPFKFDPSELSPLGHFDFVINFNNSNNKLTTRDRKTHRLDSLNYFGTNNGQHELRLVHKRSYTYTDTTEIVKFKSESSNWHYDSFFKYRIDVLTNNVTELSSHCDWDGDELTLDTLSPKRTILYSYNKDNLLAVVDKRTSFGLNKTSVLLEYSYNDQLQLISIKELLRDFASDSLLLESQNFYTYTDNGNVKSVVEYRQVEM